MPSTIAISIIAIGTIVYLRAARRQSQAGKHWSVWRQLSLVAGSLLLGVALSAPVMRWAHHDLVGHMAQHLAIGMLVPLAWVLSAPVTLMLRVLPVAAARGLVGLLQSSPARRLSHPVSAALLNIGGMYVLYLTPLFAASMHTPWLHYWMLGHFLIAGYLFCWSILAAPDVSPHTVSLRVRGSVLFLSIAAHAMLGKLMYGYQWPRHTTHGIEEIQAAAQLMYYGGDVAEGLLALAFFALWYGKTAPRVVRLTPGVHSSRHIR
ncbi:cytochrome c oxidase assembly protein [Halomonas sp. TRM85114]|uniref:cytochrome c oxidase assembly protein n=1 Tax=Halomonas jincaotanensis TaxID=2810616 RepID=UPI001BD3797B|nr:cytochrome c oxidase assembly protein [Halomonas jincaotanensis]MBS9402439.1 cytochrome c oxidase assembly protein [Halomonas jincaotanensis]